MILTLGKEHFKKMQWKNGAGETLELFRIPNPHDPSLFLFRISIAKVQSNGDFSLFHNIERTLLLLQGRGCILHFADKEMELKTNRDILHFQGENPINCHLIDGPIADFNVMTDRTWGRAETEITLTSEKIYCADEFMFIFDEKDYLLHVLQREDEFILPGHKMIVTRLNKNII